MSNTPATPKVFRQDVWIYRVTVLFLGITSVLSVLFGAWITWYFRKSTIHFSYSPALVSIGATAVGALAGLLSPNPSQNIINKESDS
jgi:uncharacterized membrane protein